MVISRFEIYKRLYNQKGINQWIVFQQILIKKYLVSPVSFLNANPRILIFFPETVLNKHFTIKFANLFFWYSFIWITWCQYAPTSFKFKASHKYTKFKTSFWKQLPPNPKPNQKRFKKWSININQTVKIILM